jgi:hypothetical protein
MMRARGADAGAWLTAVALVAALALAIAFVAAPLSAQEGAGAASATSGPNVRFGTPSATGGFGDTVTFGTTFSSDAQPERVELLASTAGDRALRVTTADVERTGDGWKATAFTGGHIVPNTTSSTASASSPRRVTCWGHRPATAWWTSASSGTSSRASA